MSKRIRKILCFGLCFALISGCTTPTAPSPTPEASSSTLTKYSDLTFDGGFDTYLSVTAWTATPENFQADFELATQQFAYYNQLFDIYHTYDGISNLKTINDQAGLAPVQVDEAIIDMLHIAKTMYDLSSGEFDVTLGPVLAIWHTYREAGINANSEGSLGTVPSASELQEAAGCIGWQYVEIDDAASTVYLNDACASLDVGGIAKGYATEKVAEALEEKGVTTGIVDAGGNNRTLGNKPDGTPWKVGIQNPDTQGNASILTLTSEGSGSFVTSGDYQRFYVAEDGNTYHHIIDPATLFPATYFHSVSIICKNSAYADALSTTLFTLSYEDGLAFIDQYNATSEDPISVIWILDKDTPINASSSLESGEYRIVYTSDLEDRITLVE